MKDTGFRGEFILGLVACAAILSIALYMEFAMGLDPCLLCMSQRVYAGRLTQPLLWRP
jgi:disulfide bond formation protein DsbB